MTTHAQAPAFNSPYEATHPQQAYFGGKPADITFLDWLEHWSNPFHFLGKVNIRDLIEEVRQLSLLQGYTFFRLKYLANKYGVTVRWMGELLRRLVKIGVLESYKDPRTKRNRYRVNPRFLRVMFGFGGPSSSSTSSSNPENIAVTLSDAMVSRESKPSEELHEGGTLPEGFLSSRAHAREAFDDEEKKIIDAFEETTGNTFQPARDRQALDTLKQLGLKGALIAIYTCAVNLAMRRPDIKVKSLAYFIPEAKTKSEMPSLLSLEYVKYAIGYWKTKQWLKPMKRE